MQPTPQLASGEIVRTSLSSPRVHACTPSVTQVPLYPRIVRNILADKPRVTRYQIDWSN